MSEHKIFYGQKWVNDNSVVLCSSKNRHSDPSLPMYEYIEYTKEVEESLERIAELEAERDAAFNKGMERAAEIVREHGLFAEEHIRKEIDND